jgi:predicted permease
MAVRNDLTYAARILRRSPVFTITAVLSLAIGIAGNAAIFSVADALLLRSRPALADPANLVEMGRSQDGSGFDNFSYPNYLDFRARNTVFAGLAGARVTPEAFGLGLGDGAERVWGTPVSDNYFDVLGVQFTRGRGFGRDEDRADGRSAVVVISDRLWHTRFESDPRILGRTMKLNGRPFTIVGVAPPGFTGTNLLGSDLWIPITAYPAVTGRDSTLLTMRAAVWMQGIARLKPGISRAQASAEMNVIAKALEREYPLDNEGKGAAIAPLGIVPGEMRTMFAAFIGFLFALVGVVLLIACTNVAGMLLARGVARAREVAVRLAVGAARGRIVRQLVTESLLLSVIGGSIGVLVAGAIIRGLRALMPALPVPVAVDLSLDWRVTAFSVALAVVTGLLFGLVPALQAAGTDLVTTLKADTGSGGVRRARLRQAFVMAQVALSVLLVVCALLFVRSLHYARRIDPGFDAANADAIALDFRLAGYDDAAGPQAAENVLARVQALPGVRSATYARVLPLTGTGLGLGRLSKPGDTANAGGIRADWNVIAPGYFAAMRWSLIAGRPFAESDRQGAPFVAIVNETLARRTWPTESALGKRLLQEIEPGQSPRELVVVGVARDAKYRSLGKDPVSFIYVPLAQQFSSDLWLVARRAGEDSTIPAVRSMLRDTEPHLPITAATSLEQATSLGLLPQRVAVWIAGAFGGVGLLLACIGIYGITAFTVTQRTREIGVRVALGATRQAVVHLVVGQAMRMAAVGLMIGLAAAAALTQLLASLLYGIQPLDPPSFAIGAGVFTTLALLAAWLPARRAASVNPVDALRSE